MTVLMDRNTDIQEKVALLIEKFAHLPKGATISYEQIEAVGGMTYRSKPWAQVMQKFHRELADAHDRWYVSVKGIGIRFVTDHERLTWVCDKIQKSASKKIRKAIRCISLIQDENIDPKYVQYKNMRLQQLLAEREMMKQNASVRRNCFAKVEGQPKSK